MMWDMVRGFLIVGGAFVVVGVVAMLVIVSLDPWSREDRWKVRGWEDRPRRTRNGEVGSDG